MDEIVTNLKDAKIGGHGSGYLLKIEAGNIYFTVYPYTDEQILFELTDITKLLQENGFADYDMELLVTTIREGSGDPVTLLSQGEAATVETTVAARSEEAVKTEPTIEIKVSKNRMEATLRTEVNDNCNRLTERLIREKIEAAGIKFGICAEAIEKLVRQTEYDVIIAKGVPQVNGVNASIVKSFNIDKRGRPEEIEHGRVDFKNLNLFILVKKGDLLAERIPHTLGTPGTDVFGDSVAAKPGKTVMLPLGKNVKLVGEHKIVADIEGQVVVANNKISVDPRIEIKGDVDLSTGNIEFSGSVFVKGSVQAGFTVKADGDVEIAGNISGGTVEGRNITVKAGIQGMQRGHIIAKEDIRTSYAENAKIVAGRDLYVTEAILHSDVSAGKRIIVAGKRGVIAGGAAVAGTEIRAKSAGNQMDTSTKLEVGINPMLRKEYQNTKKMLEKVQGELDQAKKALKILKEVPPDKLPQTKKDLLLRLTKAQFPLAGEVKKYRDRINAIEEEFLTLKDGKIKVSEMVYPGVKIIIGSIIKNVRSKEQHCTFFADDGEVKTGLY